MEGYQKRLTGLPEDLPSSVENIESTRESISNRVLSGETSILDSTKEMNKLAREAVSSVVEEISTEFDLDTDKPPFALFFFGSPSRNLMLPNSDLDIGLVFGENCTEEIKVALRSKISALPFDKVEIASWASIDDMCKENCPDMIEYSKATDAEFVAGNPDFAREHIQKVRNNDTEEDKINRFITEFGLLHKYDYLSKKNDQGFNLKYDFGASRDIIFIDWYFILKGDREQAKDGSPFFMKGLDILLDEKLISQEDRECLEDHIKLVLLVKFTLLSKFRKNGNESLIHLSDFSLHEAYKEAPEAFKNADISNGDELVSAYYDAKRALHDLIEQLYNEACSANSDLSKAWQTAKEKMVLDEDVLEVLKDKTWYNLVPFATCSKSPEILDFLVNSIRDMYGYEYVLRIASENKFLKDETKETLLNSRLADKFKKKLIITTNI